MSQNIIESEKKTSRINLIMVQLLFRNLFAQLKVITHIQLSTTLVSSISDTLQPNHIKTNITQNLLSVRLLRMAYLPCCLSMRRIKRVRPHSNVLITKMRREVSIIGATIRVHHNTKRIIQILISHLHHLLWSTAFQLCQSHCRDVPEINLELS